MMRATGTLCLPLLMNNHFSKKMVAYPEYNNPDPGAKCDNIVQGYVLVLPLHDTSPDQMTPMRSDGTRATNGT